MHENSANVVPSCIYVVPTFITKLWTLVENTSINDLITWDESGKNFHVYDQARFTREVLPLYFKQSNIASFIRQLNMYGFRKLLKLDKARQKLDRDDTQFAHPFFIKGRQELLQHIQRRVNVLQHTQRKGIFIRHDYSVTDTKVPGFLTKLWTLVEDTSIDDLITWDESGKSFHVYDQARFAREVLPHYFKHRNISTFIRQLNTYGFKRVDSRWLKLLGRDDMEFAHSCFTKGREDLLEHIKRKTRTDYCKGPQDNTQEILTNVQVMKNREDSLTTQMNGLRRENETLWREVANLRQKNSTQQQFGNKLIQCLRNLVGATKCLAPVQRECPPMIDDVNQAGRPAKFGHQLPLEGSELDPIQYPYTVDIMAEPVVIKPIGEHTPEEWQRVVTAIEQGKLMRQERRPETSQDSYISRQETSQGLLRSQSLEFPLNQSGIESPDNKDQSNSLTEKLGCKTGDTDFNIQETVNSCVEGFSSSSQSDYCVEEIDGTVDGTPDCQPNYYVEENDKTVGRTLADPYRLKESHVVLRRLYLCELCGWYGWNRVQLRSHHSTEHRQDLEKTKRNVRGPSVKDEEQLRTEGGVVRKRRRNDVTQYTCKHCKKGFSLPYLLKRHLLRHSGEKQFICEICNKGFSRSGHLTVHLRTHDGDNPFTCPICDKGFSVKSHVTRHLRTHSIEKSFFCDKLNLTVHLKTHGIDKPFTCPICDKGFSLKSQVTTHLRTHSIEKSFFCDKLNLTVHLKSKNPQS